MDVSIVIVNYNTLKITQDCINSIFEYSSNIEFEVILVDNASEDGSRDCFVKDHRITYVYSEENLGFGKANNLGLTFASGKYIFLLNSDTLLRNNAILQFYRFMEEQDRSIACVGCELIDFEGKMVISYGEFPSMSLILKQRLSHLIPVKYRKCYGFNGPYRRKIGDDCFIVDYVTGADLFIRKEVIEQCGFFDPDFFLYYEETEMQHRYRAHKYYSCIFQQPTIVHLEGKSGNKKINHLECAIKIMGSLFKYMRKTHSIFYYWTFRLLFLVISLPSLFYFKYPFKDRLLYLQKLLSS